MFVELEEGIDGWCTSLTSAGQEDQHPSEFCNVGDEIESSCSGGQETAA